MLGKRRGIVYCGLSERTVGRMRRNRCGGPDSEAHERHLCSLPMFALRG